MIGTSQAVFKDRLTLTPDPLTEDVSEALDLKTLFGADKAEPLARHFGSENIQEFAHDLPGHVFSRLSADNASKIIFSAKHRGDIRIREIESLPAKLALKIENSIWRWDMQKADWSEIVSAYNGIADFKFGLPDFTITIDHTTGFNEWGFSEHARVWIDGVFAFLLHYKGKHVATIGFTFAKGSRILLQQFQMTTSHGNRWLFKIPSSSNCALEYIIDRFAEAFPGHAILIADGADYGMRSMKDYESAINKAKEAIASGSDPEAKNVLAIFVEKKKKLKKDLPRIAGIYRNIGRYTIGQTFEYKSMRHYAIS